MRVVIGRIGKAHGIRGDVTVEVRTDEPERHFAVGTALLSTHATPLVIADARDHSGRLLLRFVGVDDRNAAEALRGTMLEAEVDPTEMPVDEDEYYDRQLIGLAAVRGNGDALGIVSDVVHLPGHDLLAVTPSTSNRCACRLSARPSKTAASACAYGTSATSRTIVIARSMTLRTAVGPVWL